MHHAKKLSHVDSDWHSLSSDAALSSFVRLTCTMLIFGRKSNWLVCRVSNGASTDVNGRLGCLTLKSSAFQFCQYI